MTIEYFFEISASKKASPIRKISLYGFRTWRLANNAANEALAAIQSDGYIMKIFRVGHNGGIEGRVLDNDINMYRK
jgi:hypothetical protein